MSVTVDANVLLYASDAASPNHDRAVEVLRGLGEGRQLVYLFWPVAMAYLRVATHAAVFADPLTPAEALGNLDALLQRPQVRAPGEGERFWTDFRRVADEVTLRGNLVPDGHVVALMRHYGVRTIVSHDRDYRRFDDIRIDDPFV